MEKYTINIIGMHCESCAKIIKEDLLDKSGVLSVQVDVDKKSGEIEIDEKQISLIDIIKIIKSLGYGASL